MIFVRKSRHYERRKKDSRVRRENTTRLFSVLSNLPTLSHYIT